MFARVCGPYSPLSPEPPTAEVIRLQPDDVTIEVARVKQGSILLGYWQDPAALERHLGLHGMKRLVLR